MKRKAIASGLFLCAAAATAAHAQPARFDARYLSNSVRVQLNAAPEERNSLRIAKLRPQALQLRASMLKLPREHIDFAAIDRLKVPVLISARAEYLGNLKVFAAADRYTASTRQNNVVVEINGTRLPIAAPRNFLMPRMVPQIQLNNAPAPAPSPSDLPMRRNFRMRAMVLTAPAPDALRNVSIDHTGYGVDISFSRFGSVYNVTVDCGGSETQDPEAIGPADEGTASGPASDECKDENALGLAKELEVAGGGEAPQ